MSDAAGEPGIAGARRRWGVFALRLAVTAGVLAALGLWLPIAALRDAILSVPPLLWLGALGAFAGGHAIAAQKWRLLLRSTGAEARIRDAFRAHAAGLFANLCLPSLVGGDVVRAGIVIARAGRPEAVALAGVADRVIDTAALIVLACTGAALAPERIDGAGGSVLALAGGSILVAAGAGPWLLLRVRPGHAPERLRPLLAKLQTAVRTLIGRPAVAVGVFVLSLAVQGGFVALNLVLGREMGIEVAPTVWLLVWPLAKLVALVPISLGGIGVREAALATLLLPAGVPAELAVGQSLVWETLLVSLGALAGSAALWLGRRDARQRAAGAAP
ncbi:MAG: YbhN family protein [Myxococcota bacterium]